MAQPFLLTRSRIVRSLLRQVTQQRRNLNLQEYQSKQIMADNGLSVQKFRVVSSTNEAKEALLNKTNISDCQEYVIKAQVLAGGRGKGFFKKSGMKGGVQLTKDKQVAIDVTGKMLQDYLVTKQTTKDGVLVSKVMIAEALDIDKELYVAILLDRAAGGPVIVASPKGGVNIEEVAESSPADIHKFPVPVEGGMSENLALRVAKEGLGIKDEGIASKAAREITNLYQLFVKSDSTQIEINPLGITPSKDVVCFDAKLEFDENAQFRQKWLLPLIETIEDEDPRITMAKKANLNFVPMDGNIGCLVNGAGLAMATMDIIHHYGGNPANFLDVGGGVNQQGVEAAFKLITQDPNVKAILVNIFGGIVNCLSISEGLVAAKHLINVPLVVRLEGTNQAAARKLLERYDDIISADNLDDAARKAVSAAGVAAKQVKPAAS